VGLYYRAIHKIHHLFANTLPIDSGELNLYFLVIDSHPHHERPLIHRQRSQCNPMRSEPAALRIICCSPKLSISCAGTESPFEWLFDETHVNVRGVPWALQLFQFLFVNGHLLGHDCLSVT
jgi:hypothetical protein